MVWSLVHTHFCDRRFAVDTKVLSPMFSPRNEPHHLGCSLVNEVSKVLDKQLATVILYGHIRPLQQLARMWPYGMAPITTGSQIHRFLHLHPSPGVSDGPSLPQGCTTADRIAPHKLGCCLKLQQALPPCAFPCTISP
jgi:hypothetical protein